MITDQITDLQKRKIKEMVDELIVNHGILKFDRETISLEGMEFGELTNRAFKYYRMIMKGESPLDIDISPGRKARNVDSAPKSRADHCIGCNQRLTRQDINLKMPVCTECRQKIKVDYDILRELLR
ncbi:MAG: hypothetical protein GY839_09035 [candidate division Zixibacteria bacterium]|nr:hypothetical protein [candidate division Zixibacteria bacterium]